MTVEAGRDERLSRRRITPAQVFSDYGLYIALAVLVIVFSSRSSAFLTVGNWKDMLQQVSTVGIMAVGETLVILAGGIDISIGSVLGLGGMVSALAVRDLGAGPAVATILGVLSGLAVGLFNGIVISRLRVNPFITTLASMAGVRGIVYIVSNQYDVHFSETSSFLVLGRGYVGPVPVSVVILAGVAVVAVVLEKKTTFGRSIRALGGNEAATRLSGVYTERVRISTYAISGMCAALAGVIITSQIAIAVPYQGTGAELDVIAAVIVGGVALTGGVGSVVIGVVGAILIAVLGNGMALLNVSSIWQMVIKGGVIVAAASLYSVARGRR